MTDDDLRTLVRDVRQKASALRHGSLHSIWDVIGDAESLLKGGSATLTRAEAEAHLLIYAGTPPTTSEEVLSEAPAWRTGTEGLGWGSGGDRVVARRADGSEVEGQISIDAYDDGDGDEYPVFSIELADGSEIPIYEDGLTWRPAVAETTATWLSIPPHDVRVSYVEHEPPPVVQEKSLIEKIVEAKTGDKSFLLANDDASGAEQKWIAAIGNKSRYVLIIENLAYHTPNEAADFHGTGDTPDAAIHALAAAMGISK